MSSTLTKRFWQRAEAVSDDGSEGSGEAYRILLDGRPVRLPGGAPLRLRTLSLAQAVAGEWQAAAGGAVGAPFSMDGLPLTRLAGTMQERIAANRPAILEGLLAYAGSDLLCYRAADPVFAATQEAAWGPWLAWAEATFDARLAVVSGIMPVRQTDEAQAALRAALASCSDAALTGLGILVPALGSLVLGLAVAGNALPAEEAWRLGRLEETLQAERWGRDVEAEARAGSILADILAADRFIALDRKDRCND